MKEVLLATNNPGKLAEMQALLQDCGVKIVSRKEAGVADDFDVEEMGKSFHEIAELKARSYAEHAQVSCLADDSGLMIDALDGQPGIHSKRFVEGSDEDRSRHVLKLLEGQENRRAKFVTVMCLFDWETKQVQFFEGEVHGRIGIELQGTQGFGYDPIFIPDGYEQTFAQLGKEVKNTRSHRARALQKVRAFFKKHA